MENILPFKDIICQETLTRLGNYLTDNNIKNINISGLYGSSKSFAIASSVNEGVNVIIMDNKEDAQFLTNDLYNLTNEECVFFFPCSSNISQSKINTIKDSSQKVQRSAAISSLNSYFNGEGRLKKIILIGYPASVYEKIPNKKVLKKNLLKIRKGDMVSHDFIKEALAEYKFVKVDFVGEPGEYALRGGIIDIFSYSSDKPYRIDFFGNEVESIREFDTNTQRSVRELEEVEIFPNLYDDEVSEEENNVDIFEFIGKKNCIVWVNDISVLQGEIYKDVVENMMCNRIVSFNGLPDEDASVEFRISPQPSFNKNFNLLLDDINRKISEGYTIYISSENERQFERLRNIFAHNSGDDAYKHLNILL